MGGGVATGVTVSVGIGLGANAVSPANRGEIAKVARAKTEATVLIMLISYYLVLTLTRLQI